MSDAPRTIDDFLELVRKSGLVEEGRLDSATEAWPDRSAQLSDAVPQTLIDGGLLTQWQVDQLRKGRHKGFTLGKYKLLRLLGAGGMSSVYLAEHATLHTKVAIKVLPLNRVEKTSYLARFEREAQASARLSHHNIVRAFDLDTSGSIHFIAMEYVDGVDLHAKVKQDGPLPLRDAVDYLRQAALGLQYAHEEGFVHRDIKPANLILDGRGTVKILDLGLAFVGGEDDGSLTKEHDEKTLGTADYLAPEQARDSHKADARSDIYSLGCTFYYLLTGRPPFAKGSLAERIRAHFSTPAPNLLDTRADVPAALVELYFRMLEKHPDARPQTAGEVAAALAAWLATQEKGPAARPEPPRRAPPRRQPSSGSGVGGPPAPRPGGSGVSPPAARPAGGSGSDFSFTSPAPKPSISLPLPQPVRKSATGRSGSGIRGVGGSGVGGGPRVVPLAASAAGPSRSGAGRGAWWNRRGVVLGIGAVVLLAIAAVGGAAAWFLLAPAEGVGGDAAADSARQKGGDKPAPAEVERVAAPTVKRSGKKEGGKQAAAPEKRPEAPAGPSALDKALETKPAEADPDAKPADAKPADAKPADAKPADAK